MKRITNLLLIATILVVLCAGCAYNKTTQLKLKGESITVQLAGIGTIKGTGVEGTLNRSVSMVAEKKRKHEIKNEIGDTKGSIKVD